jgi:hypothetical protein
MSLLFVLSIAGYFFIGGVLNGIFFSDREDEDSLVAVFVWPVIVFIWLGDELGYFIKKRFNK